MIFVNTRNFLLLNLYLLLEHRFLENFNSEVKPNFHQVKSSKYVACFDGENVGQGLIHEVKITCVNPK